LDIVGGEKDNWRVEIVTSDGQFRRLNNVVQFFYLIGYQNNPDLMKNLGCQVDSVTGVVDYSPLTGQVKTSFSNDPGRIYISGAAASRPEDRNQEVIPGMISSIPRMVFTETVMSYRAAWGFKKG